MKKRMGNGPQSPHHGAGVEFVVSSSIHASPAQRTCSAADADGVVVRPEYNEDDDDALSLWLASSSKAVNSTAATPSSQPSSLSYSLFLTGVIGLWFVANGMNGIAMRSLATDLRQQQQPTTTHASQNGDEEQYVVSIMAVTMGVTALQLLLAFGLGIVLMVVYELWWRQQQKRKRHSSSSSSSSSSSAHHHHHPAILVAVGQRLFSNQHHNSNHTVVTSSSSNNRSLWLATLHGIAMYSTNLGFMYGSASLVQVIKLVEPFWTVLLQNVLLQQHSTNNNNKHPPTQVLLQLPSVGVVSSMLLTVGSAYTLVHADQTEIHATALVFALLSTVTMSGRNVLQKQVQQQEELLLSNSTTQPHNHRLRKLFDFSVPDDNDDNGANAAPGFAARTATATDDSPTTVSIGGRKAIIAPRLEQALGQFTKLSLYAGLVMLVNGESVLLACENRTCVRSLLGWKLHEKQHDTRVQQIVSSRA